MSRQLPPFVYQEKYFEQIEKEIKRIWDQIIYNPLKRAFDTKTTFKMTLTNAEGVKIQLNNEITDPLYVAVKEGRVWYENGQFKGQFNARIAKSLRDKGATYNTDSKTYSLGVLPVEIRMATALATARYEFIKKSVFTTLADMNIESINMISDLPDKYAQTINWMEDDFKKTVSSVTIGANMSEDDKGRLTAEYTMDMDRYVKGWAEDEIMRLRGAVEKSVIAGKRVDVIAKELEHSFSLSRNKAKFLARQESGLMIAKFRELRYTAIGSERYKWKTRLDGKERDDHRILDGNEYRWDSPPVTNLKTGAHNHPNEDFGCRCIAIALID
jgi:SPP1 gp7 family putative phage head morphogenesis protein